MKNSKTEVPDRFIPMDFLRVYHKVYISKLAGLTLVFLVGNLFLYNALPFYSGDVYKSPDFQKFYSFGIYFSLLLAFISVCMMKEDSRYLSLMKYHSLYNTILFPAFMLIYTSLILLVLLYAVALYARSEAEYISVLMYVYPCYLFYFSILSVFRKKKITAMVLLSVLIAPDYQITDSVAAFFIPANSPAMNIFEGYEESFFSARVILILLSMLLLTYAAKSSIRIIAFRTAAVLTIVLLFWSMEKPSEDFARYFGNRRIEIKMDSSIECMVRNVFWKFGYIVKTADSSPVVIEPAQQAGSLVELMDSKGVLYIRYSPETPEALVYALYDLLGHKFMVSGYSISSENRISMKSKYGTCFSKIHHLTFDQIDYYGTDKNKLYVALKPIGNCIRYLSENRILKAGNIHVILTMSINQYHRVLDSSVFAVNSEDLQPLVLLRLVLEQSDLSQILKNKLFREYTMHLKSHQ